MLDQVDGIFFKDLTQYRLATLKQKILRAFSANSLEAREINAIFKGFSRTAMLEQIAHVGRTISVNRLLSFDDVEPLFHILDEHLEELDRKS